MATYLERIKASNPDAYAKIAKLGKYSADEVFGGEVQDFQAQLFTALSPDIIAKANSKEGLVPVEAGYDDGVSYTTTVTGYTKDLEVVNGIPVTANYDVNGNLTGYEGNQAYRTWLDGKNSVAGRWDASGNANPVQYASKGGGFLKNTLSDIMSDPILGTVANIAAAYYGSTLGLGAFGAPLGSATLAAAQGKDIEDIAKSAALSYGAGQIAQGVGGLTDSSTIGQLAGKTGAGLLSGQDLETSLTNAAINTGANAAASGIFSPSAPQTDSSYTFTPSSADYTGADYSLTGDTGGLGLKADLAPLDVSNPYSFDTNFTATGGLGFNADLAPLDFSNLYSLNSNSGNLDSMGGGTGLTIPNQEGATLGSIGAVAEAPKENPKLVDSGNSAGQGLLASIIKSALTGSSSSGSQGTGNMATSNNNNYDFSSLFGGLLRGSGGLMQGSTNNEALQEQANSLRATGQQAATASQFRPVGTTTNFGTSNFQVDPTTGQLQSAGYSLNPQLQGYQNTLMAGGQQSLTDAANLQNLGRGYIAQSPEAAAQQYMTAQQALLAPSRDMESARLANRLQQTGRTGVSVAQGGNLGMANPEQQALANARAIQDLNLAAQAQQQGRAQTTFGQGLLTGAYDPFNAGLKSSATLEGLGQQPFGMSTDLAKQFQQANATGAKYNLAAQDAATSALLEKNQYNPYADILRGSAGNPQFTGALGGMFNNTGIGSSIGKYLGGLLDSNTSYTGGPNGLDISNMDYNYLSSIYAGGNPFENVLAPGETWDGE